MSVYNGYVTISHDSYDEWRNATLGNSYDVDGYPPNQPYQCWDFAAEFWYNLGFPQGYPLTGGQDATGVWLNREQNKGNEFDLIYTLAQIEVGDVVCFSNAPYGHIGFAEERYNGGAYIKLLSQNASNHPYVTSENVPVLNFQGAFRYRGWHIPPTPTRGRKGKFPWVLYARKLRGNV